MLRITNIKDSGRNMDKLDLTKAYSTYYTAANRPQLAEFEADGLHHEIYLSDPRKVNPAVLKTILRLPVRKKPVT
jgi:hypothetical protein